MPSGNDKPPSFFSSKRTEDIELPLSKGQKPDPRLKQSSPLEGLKKAGEGLSILKKKGIV